jgi:hypothetical protein
VVSHLVDAAGELVECQTVTHGPPMSSFPLTPDARRLSTCPIGSGRFGDPTSILSPLTEAGTRARLLDAAREVGGAPEVLLDLEPAETGFE